ncbi:MAG: polysaccharide deacetylase family protein [Bacteroidales bacterium]|nr:polysaccharide deacetylase family protein [Candidatus Colicola equi]
MRINPNILYQIPSWLQRLVPGVEWRGDKTHKCVYLTFDDGPVPEVTPQVLDILDRYQVKATFFWVGENVYRYPELAQEVFRRGHQIGNHTFNHLPSIRVSHSIYSMNWQLCDEVISKTLGPKWKSHLFRPPYGRMRPRQQKQVGKDHRIILWDILTHDYNKDYTPARITRIVQRYMRNGSIILMHDSKKSAPNTLEALPMIIEWLQAEGYELRTL